MNRAKQTVNLAALLMLLSWLTSGVPANAHAIETARRACTDTKARWTAQSNFPMARIASCDFLAAKYAPTGYFVLALHSDRRCEGGCSRLLGWFAVEKSTGRVFEWDVAEDQLGKELAKVYALPPKVHGDFDRDGRADVAQISKSGGEYRVVIHPGAHPKVSIVVGSLGALREEFFLSKARPGKWETWCGKGGGSEDEPCPRTSVKLRGGELTFGVKEASESVVVWTGNRFEAVLLSD